MGLKGERVRKREEKGGKAERGRLDLITLPLT